MRILNLKVYEGEAPLIFGILGPEDVNKDQWPKETRIDGLIISGACLDAVCESLVKRAQTAKFLILNKTTGVETFFSKCPGKWLGLFLNNIEERGTLRAINCSSGLNLIVAGSPNLVCDLRSFLHEEKLTTLKIRKRGGVFGAVELLLGKLIRELTRNI